MRVRGIMIWYWDKTSTSAAEKSLRQLEVAGLFDGVSAEEIRQEQKKDPTFNGLRRNVASCDERVSRTGKNN